MVLDVRRNLHQTTDFCRSHCTDNVRILSRAIDSSPNPHFDFPCSAGHWSLVAYERYVDLRVALQLALVPVLVSHTAGVMDLVLWVRQHRPRFSQPFCVMALEPETVRSVEVICR